MLVRNYTPLRSTPTNYNPIGGNSTMANLSITAANVKANTGASYNKQYLAGENLTPGQPVYLNSSSKWMKAGTGNATVANAAGITLNTASANQTMTVQTAGNITIGAAVSPGKIYVVSSNSGLICLNSDLTTGDYVTVLGYANSNTTMILDIIATNTTLA